MPGLELPASVLTIARLLRLVAFAANVSATIIMGISRETRTFFNPYYFHIKVDYSEIEVFKAFLGVNIAASVYGLFVAALPAKSKLWPLFLVIDVILFGLLASIDTGAMLAAYLHKNGDSQAHWAPICDKVPTYCSRVMGAAVAGFIGVFFYLLIIIYSLSVTLNSLLVH